MEDRWGMWADGGPGLLTVRRAGPDGGEPILVLDQDRVVAVVDQTQPPRLRASRKAVVVGTWLTDMGSGRMRILFTPGPHLILAVQGAAALGLDDPTP